MKETLLIWFFILREQYYIGWEKEIKGKERSRRWKEKIEKEKRYKGEDERNKREKESYKEILL